MSLTGNCNLVYAIIRKRSVFHQLANLPSDMASIQKALQRGRTSGISRSNPAVPEAEESSRRVAPVEPSLLKASLEATPGESQVSERVQEAEHWTSCPVEIIPLLLRHR